MVSTFPGDTIMHEWFLHSRGTLSYMNGFYIPGGHYYAWMVSTFLGDTIMHDWFLHSREGGQTHSCMNVFYCVNAVYTKTVLNSDSFALLFPFKQSCVSNNMHSIMCYSCMSWLIEFEVDMYINNLCLIQFSK